MTFSRLGFSSWPVDFCRRSFQLASLSSFSFSARSAVALLGQRLAFFLLHRISISDSRVTKRVFKPSLSAARSRASLPVAKSTPSIS